MCFGLDHICNCGTARSASSFSDPDWRIAIPQVIVHRTGLMSIPTIGEDVVRRFVLLPLLLLALLFAGCTQIWNASDLVEWVDEQAVDSGCDPATIELEDWYVQTDDGNVWQGTCVDKESGERVALAIPIDNVWTPSQAVDNSAGIVTEESAAEIATPLSAEALRNASYSGIYEEPVPLVDGWYEGNAFDEANPPIFTVEYIENSELYGDLDGDGIDDAVVFLMERGGGTGAFIYVAAQFNQGGQPVDAGAVLIGDRVMVKTAGIVDGEVLLEAVVEGPGDAACCPSHKTRKDYALQEGMLAEVALEDAELVRVSASDLDGTSWTLVELNYERPALEEPEVTIAYVGNQISGSGGCNNYTADFSLGEDNPFVLTIGPIASTMMDCPDPISEQESAYFAALQNASQWGYVIGRLAIYHVDDQRVPGRLLFVPSEPVEATMQGESTGQNHATPGAVADLEAAYGAPSQAAFGSAVFSEKLPADADLEQAALATYEYFVGDLWNRYGEDAWMGPWKEVYVRPAGGQHRIVNELASIEDRDALLSTPMILGVDPDALSAVFDVDDMKEVRVYNLGDGGAMSGLLVAGRSADTGKTVFLVFLLD